jgi:DNA repair exonuclease SbcCD ATPase subunit
MASSTIYFESCKETKSGSIKDEVNPIINMDGENEISIKTLSGGERTSIDLAVDLALIEMIETKAGKGVDFFILDEPFDGLDAVNKTECLDILQNLDTNKKIIIVDHSAELKALVHDIIMVVRQGEDSFVV